MKNIGEYLLKAAVALYLFANGIIGFTKERGEFGTMAKTIFGRGDFTDVLTVILSICAIIAGVLVILALLKIEVPFTDLILLIFICLWLAFIAIMDIINPINQKDSIFRKNTWEFLQQLAAHVMVLGALITSTKRFGRN